MNIYACATPDTLYQFEVKTGGDDYYGVHFPCIPDYVRLPGNYEEVPNNLLSRGQQLIGGMKARCSTKIKTVCRLTKFIHHKGKNYCLKRCRQGKIKQCI